MEFSVGQEVYLVPTQKRMGNPHFAKIEKIGRKWITLADNYGRFCPESMLVDGGDYSPPYACYLSETAYRVKLDNDIAWGKLKQFVGGNRPKYITATDIARCMEILAPAAPEKSA